MFVLSKNLSFGLIITFFGIAMSFSNSRILSGSTGIEHKPLFSCKLYGILYRCLLEISMVSMSISFSGFSFFPSVISLISLPFRIKNLVAETIRIVSSNIDAGKLIRYNICYIDSD